MAFLGIGVIIAFNQADSVGLHVFSKHNLEYLYNKISSSCVLGISFRIWSGPDALYFFKIINTFNNFSKENHIIKIIV